MGREDRRGAGRAFVGGGERRVQPGDVKRAENGLHARSARREQGQPQQVPSLNARRRKQQQQLRHQQVSRANASSIS